MSNKKPANKSYRFLNAVERVGNKLPHPIALFGLLALFTIFLSAILSAAGVSVVGEALGSDGVFVEKTYTVTSLLSREGLAWIVTSVVSNFTSYAPLGVVLIAMVGIGMADGTGYLTSVLKKALSVIPQRAVVPMLVFVGIMSNIASDAGYVIVIPIGMMIMLASGRHPLAGFAATLAGVSGGYSANLIVATVDAQLAAISTEAARIVDPNYEVNSACNWFFLMVATVLLTIIGTLITEKIVEPKLGEYTGDVEVETDFNSLTEIESKALKRANLSLLISVIVLVVLCIPQNSFLRDADTGSLITGPLLKGVSAIISVIFFIVGTTYGYGSGMFKSHRDVCKQMGVTMATMGSYLALAVVASQFIKYFNYTGIGTMLSVAGANWLSRINVSPIILVLCFIAFCALMNLVMASATAKWTLLAPIFIPMLMKIGMSPELVQAAYRIADSSTNPISPVMAYLAVMIAFCQKYEKNSGIGTVWSLMLPYCATFLVMWAVLLIVFMLTGIPLGPGVAYYLS